MTNVQIGYLRRGAYVVWEKDLHVIIDLLF